MILAAERARGADDGMAGRWRGLGGLGRGTAPSANGDVLRLRTCPSCIRFKWVETASCSRGPTNGAVKYSDALIGPSTFADSCGCKLDARLKLLSSSDKLSVSSECNPSRA